MTEVAEKARKRLAEIEAEADALRTFLRVYDALAADEDVVLESREGGSVGYDVVTASPAKIVESARSLMKERGRPLTRSQLVMLLKEKGLNLPGKDATKNIGTVIWRSKQFDNIAGEGYWPKDFSRWMPQRNKEPDLL